MTGQLTLPVSEKRMEAPEGLMLAALAWIDENPEAWRWITNAARLDAMECGRVFIKGYIESLRHRPLPHGSRDFKIPNAFSAAFTRILRAWHPELEHAIPVNRSKLDGVTIPPRPY